MRRIQEDLEANGLAPLRMNGVPVAISIGQAPHHDILARLQKRCLAPATDQGLPGLRVALALLLKEGEADDTGPTDRDIGLEGIEAEPVLRHLLGGHRRPLAASK